MNKFSNFKFTDLWNKFSSDLLIFIKSKISNESDAEDILQEVFVKIFKKVDSLKEVSKIKSWLYTITRNTIIDYYRRGKDSLLDQESMQQLTDNLEEESNMNDEVADCLKSMIFKLPDKYKEVYEKYENEGLKHKEIAEELDISVSTSKVRLLRAKEIFKNNLKKCCHFEVDSYGNILDYKKKDN